MATLRGETIVQESHMIHLSRGKEKVEQNALMLDKYGNIPYMYSSEEKK
jgi:hypothetical protein